MERSSMLAVIDAEIQRLTKARSLLANGLSQTPPGSLNERPPRRHMSAESRRLISLAQKKR
jgi:hypothetical protein